MLGGCLAVVQPTNNIIAMSSHATPPPPLGQGTTPQAAAAVARDKNTSKPEVSKTPLYTTYPINSFMELTLAPHREVVRGLIYTTDEISNSIVLKKSLPHTTLSSEIRVVNAASVLERKTLQPGGLKHGNKEGAQTSKDSFFDGETSNKDASGSNDDVFESVNDDLTLPLPAVSRKALEERERRAMRLAEESFRHVNQKASPEGQTVFNRLVKACNEVVWRGESILVLNQIRVDPPYSKDDCKLISGGTGMSGGSLNEGSLDRVKMIVAAASERTSE